MHPTSHQAKDRHPHRLLGVAKTSGNTWLALATTLCVGALSQACSGRGTVAVGGACTRDEACVTGACIREKSTMGLVAWTGGYCSGDCSSAVCPEGTCVAFSDGRSYCVSPCADNAQCRAGYICSAGVGACLPDCRLGWSCGPSLVCDSLTGACTVAGTVPGTIPLGAACTINLECVAGLCIPERIGTDTIAWTGGSCSQACASATCPSGAVCAPMEDGTAYCVPSCAGTADCRAGYTCDTEIWGCLPDCRLGWSCGTYLVCDAVSGTCMSRSIPDGGVRDAGGFGRDDAGGSGRDDAGGFGRDDAGGQVGPGPGGTSP